MHTKESKLSIEITQGSCIRVPDEGLPTDMHQDITTGGMGPCVGVIIYDHDTMVTYGAHLQGPVGAKLRFHDI